MLQTVGFEEFENRLERKAVLLAKGDDNAVVGCRRLKLKIERPAKPLSERESPRSIDSRTMRRMDHELHPTALIEESLGNNRLLIRQRSQGGGPGFDIENCLLGTHAAQPAFANEPVDGVGLGHDSATKFCDFFG